MKASTPKYETNITMTKHNGFLNRKYQDYAWAYLMIAPTIIGLLILNIWPIFETVKLSLHGNGNFGAIGEFIGFENYKTLLGDKDLWSAAINTFKYAVISVPLSIFISLFIAVLLNSNIKGKSIYRTIYFLPIISAPAAIAMVWRWLYNGDYGLINYLLSLVGIKGPQWTSDPKTALWCVIIIGIYTTLGYNMVLLLAGLQDIPSSLYEAADIDGAGSVGKFFAVTLPLISPTMFFVVITSIIAGLQVFDYIFMIWDTKKIGIQYTQSIVLLFYKNSFILNNKSYGSAIAIFLLVIILLITFVQLRLQKKWVHYQ